MKATFCWLSILVAGAIVAGSLPAESIAAGPLLFDRAEYTARRVRFMDKSPYGAAVFLGAATPASDLAFCQGHDFGYFTGVEIPSAYLGPGFVFACDLQLFRLQENIGLRIEDTITITEKDGENFSTGVPRKAAEIEAIMKKEGLLQLYEGACPKP